VVADDLWANGLARLGSSMPLVRWIARRWASGVALPEPRSGAAGLAAFAEGLSRQFPGSLSQESLDFLEKSCPCRFGLVENVIATFEQD